MGRTKLGIEVAVLLLCVGLAVAQEGANIVVAGEIVARVRDKGPYDSIVHRAAAIDEAINDVIAAGNLGMVEISLKDVDGLWTVFVGDKRIMAVYPAEAEANQVVAQELGNIWVNNLQVQLPKAMPVAVTALAPPAETTPEEPATEAVTNVGTSTVEVIEVPVATETPEITAIQGTKLLILDAFNTVRGLDENGYLGQRDALAANLLSNLVQVWSGGRESVEIEEPEIGVADTGVPGPTPPGPVLPGTAEEVEVEIGPPTGTGVGAADVSDLIDGEALTEGVPEGDANWARVPQKRRIKQKFELASKPFYALRRTDPTAAAPIEELLSAARKEFVAEDFDACEEHLDYALKLLGVGR